MGGNVEDSTFVSADADGYTVTKDGNTWQGRLNDSSVALLVTHADGTTARFKEDDVALAFNNANANPGSTITLFKDVAHGGVTVAQNLTLDLNGRTYTYNSTVFRQERRHLQHRGQFREPRRYSCGVQIGDQLPRMHAIEF